MKRILLLSIITLTISAIVLGAIQLVLSNRFATSGEEVRVLFDKEFALRKENEALQNEVQYLRSLNRIASRSTELGLIPLDSHIVLSDTRAVAYAQ